MATSRCEVLELNIETINLGDFVSLHLLLRTQVVLEALAVKNLISELLLFV